MSTPAFAEALFFLVGMYMAISYISIGNLFQPHFVKDRVVIVTAATSQIGRQLALEYSKMNAKLFLVGTDADRLDSMKRDCLVAGATDASFLAGDITSKDFQSQIVHTAEQQYGRIDYLILHPDDRLPTDTRAWNDTDGLRSTLDDYVMSTVGMTAVALPSLRRSRGYIGLVSTLPGVVPLPYLAGVSASKAALKTYFASLRQELKQGDSYVSVTSVTLDYMAGVDGSEELGGWGELFGRWGTVKLENAAWWATFYIGGRKKEVTFPFAAQCHSVLHGWFPSLYEDPQMLSVSRLLTHLPFISA